MRAQALRLLLSIGACGGLLLSHPTAQAQPTMQPGLWEASTQTSSSNPETQKAMAQAQAQMAKMPPEQRAMIEKAMAEKGVGIGAGGNTLRLCISKEQSEMRQMPVQEGCTQNTRYSGNTIHTTFSCTGPVASNGEGRYTFTSPTTYEGETSFVTTRAGKPETLQMRQTGKWLSADCGAIKPMASPAKAK
jgi:hypothetical protein